MNRQTVFAAHCLLNPRVAVDDAEPPCLNLDVIAAARAGGWQLRQMPCPEFGLLGKHRWWMTWEQYGSAGASQWFSRLADLVADEMAERARRGEVLAFLGVAASPSMGVTVTFDAPGAGGRPGHWPPDGAAGMADGPGRFVIALQDCLAVRGLELPGAAEDLRDIPDGAARQSQQLQVLLGIPEVPSRRAAQAPPRRAVALVADRYVNEPDGGLDWLQVLAGQGYGVIQLPGPDISPGLAERYLAEISIHVAEHQRDQCDMVLIGDGRPGGTAAAGWMRSIDRLDPASAAELQAALAARDTQPARGQSA